MQSNQDTGVGTTVDTYPISGTTMTYVPASNSLYVQHSGGEKSYSSGSVLRISINEDAEYEVEDPGQSISNYNYNKLLSHSNLQCFAIQARAGIGVTDFRDFRIKDTWDLDDCAIGLELADSALVIGFNSNTPPCYTEQQVKNASCT